nr:hypothetical protein Iba_chr15cCG5230 [Ipomoea batatas]
MTLEPSFPPCCGWVTASSKKSRRSPPSCKTVPPAGMGLESGTWLSPVNRSTHKLVDVSATVVGTTLSLDKLAAKGLVSSPDINGREPAPVIAISSVLIGPDMGIEIFVPFAHLGIEAPCK